MKEDISQRMAHLSPEQRLLLQRKIAKLKQGKTVSTALIHREPAQRPAHIPLSFAQERLWFLDQLDPGNPAYNIPMMMSFSGHLDTEKLIDCLAKIVQRHETLRTTFAVQNGAPVQIIAARQEVVLATEDLRMFSSEEQTEEFERRSATTALHRFDLQHGPLFQATLFLLDTENAILQIVVHHIIFDGWSTGLLRQEIIQSYTLLTTGSAQPLPALDVQYADYALWQREYFQDSALEEHSAYWREQLQGVPALISLPTDKIRPPVQTYTGSHASFTLDTALANNIRTLSRQEEVTLFTTLLTTFALLLAHKTGLDDIVVGTPVASRTHIALEHLLGSFANTLVLRIRTGQIANFREALHQTQSVMREAYAHQELPLAKVVEVVKPERAMNYNPLFQVMVNFTDAVEKTEHLPTVAISYAEAASKAIDFDLFLTLTDDQEHIHGKLGYNTDLYDHVTIEGFLEEYQRLLESLVKHPDRDLSQVPELRVQTIVLTSTFTDKFVVDPLAFWLRYLAIPSTIACAPYNQVFQQLLDASSLLSRNADGFNVVLLRFEDWLHFEAAENKMTFSPRRIGKIEQNVKDLIAALHVASERSPQPCLLYICPEHPQYQNHTAWRSFFKRMEQKISDAIQALPGISLYHYTEVLAAYPVAIIHDHNAEEIGHVPFTREFFAALATHIARVIASAHFPVALQRLWPASSFTPISPAPNNDAAYGKQDASATQLARLEHIAREITTIEQLMERLQPAKRVRSDKDTMIPWVEPRDKREITIAEIWQEILHLTGVSVYDDFFTLGGHSLLATQVISSLRDAFHVKLSLQEFFARPTIAALALYIKEKDGEEEDIRPALIPTPRTSSFYALSFAQQRLWFVHALDPDSTAYTIPEAIHLNGHLDVHALQQSLSEIVQRHEILRTTFVSVEGQTFQRVSPPSELRLPIIDLRSNEERIGETQRLIREYIQQPFDLTEGPLLRAYLFLLAEEEHVLFICLHHIITDGWSMEVFEQELVDTYTAYHSGQKPHLAALPIQYIDYALWQRAWLKDRVLEQQLTYWKQKLAGIPPLLSLPTDEPRPARQTFRGAHQTMQLPADLSEEISRFCQKEHVTVYMLALAAFTTLLYRLSGQEDIVVGSAIANRDDTLTWNMIGFFANTLILRTDLAGNPQVRDLLSRVKETTLQAYDHQDLPFERLVSELHPERNLRYNPLFQVMFVFQNAPASTRDLPELTWKNFDFASETTRFDLSFHFWETSDGVKGRLMYATDLFYSSTIASFLKRFEVLLAAMVRHPEMPIAHIPLLSPDEQQQLQPAGGIGETAMPSYVKSLLREKIRMLRSGGNNEFA